MYSLIITIISMYDFLNSDLSNIRRSFSPPLLRKTSTLKNQEELSNNVTDHIIKGRRRGVVPLYKFTYCLQLGVYRCFNPSYHFYDVGNTNTKEKLTSQTTLTTRTKIFNLDLRRISTRLKHWGSEPFSTMSGPPINYVQDKDPGPGLGDIVLEVPTSGCQT